MRYLLRPTGFNPRWIRCAPLAANRRPRLWLSLFMMLERMQTGLLKVFRHLTDWLKEFRLYHRDAGKVVKLRENLISATRYALMCRASPSRRGRRASRASWNIRRWGLYDRGTAVREAAEDESIPIVASLPCRALYRKFARRLITHLRSRRKLTLPPQGDAAFDPNRS